MLVRTRILLICFVLGVITSIQAQSNFESPEQFGPSAENCSIYLRELNWLPPAYAINAQCACLTTPNTPEANVIRNFLQVKLMEIPDSIKNLSQVFKENLAQKAISKRQYKRFVKKTLTPIFYNEHVEAYRMVGCISGPSPYWTWKLVTLKPINNCKLTWFCIRYFGGSCHGRRGKW